MRTTGKRVDAKDNRTRLLQGVGQLLSTTGAVSLSHLAETSNVSKSTTYRNFSTPQDAIDAYVNDFLQDFETSLDSQSKTNNTNTNDQWLPVRTLCQTWCSAVDSRSQALIHVRSTEGFLTRVRAGDPIINRINETVRSTLMQSLDTHNPEHADANHGVFLWNLLLDPRELLDLATHRGESVATAGAILTADLLKLLGATKTEMTLS